MITFILFYSRTYGNHSNSHFFCISAARKPIVAAVEGFALGGGFEIALVSVIVYFRLIYASVGVLLFCSVLLWLFCRNNIIGWPLVYLETQILGF